MTQVIIGIIVAIGVVFAAKKIFVKDKRVSTYTGKARVDGPENVSTGSGSGSSDDSKIIS